MPPLWLPQDKDLGGAVTASGAVATRMGLAGVPWRPETVRCTPSSRLIPWLADLDSPVPHLGCRGRGAGARRAKAEGLNVTADVSISSLLLTGNDISAALTGSARVVLRQLLTAMRCLPHWRTARSMCAGVRSLPGGQGRQGAALPKPGGCDRRGAVHHAVKWSRDWVPLNRALAVVTSAPVTIAGQCRPGRATVLLGQLKVGESFDLCIVVDPEAEWTVDPKALCRSQGKEHTLQWLRAACARGSDYRLTALPLINDRLPWAACRCFSMRCIEDTLPVRDSAPPVPPELCIAAPVLGACRFQVAAPESQRAATLLFENHEQSSLHKIKRPQLACGSGAGLRLLARNAAGRPGSLRFAFLATPPAAAARICAGLGRKRCCSACRVRLQVKGTRRQPKGPVLMVSKTISLARYSAAARAVTPLPLYLQTPTSGLAHHRHRWRRQRARSYIQRSSRRDTVRMVGAMEEAFKARRNPLPSFLKGRRAMDAACSRFTPICSKPPQCITMRRYSPWGCALSMVQRQAAPAAPQPMSGMRPCWLHLARALFGAADCRGALMARRMSAQGRDRRAWARADTEVDRLRQNHYFIAGALRA